MVWCSLKTFPVTTGNKRKVGTISSYICRLRFSPDDSATRRRVAMMLMSRAGHTARYDGLCHSAMQRYATPDDCCHAADVDVAPYDIRSQADMRVFTCRAVYARYDSCDILRRYARDIYFALLMADAAIIPLMPRCAYASYMLPLAQRY